MRRTTIVRALTGASAIALLPTTAFAQATATDTEASAAADEAADDGNVIIVTGTRVDRSGFDTPLSVSVLGDESLRTFAGSGSQADILQQIPSVKAEGGGGEVATNLRVRGLPSGGQFEFTPLNYDGVTVLSAFGLNSSSFDFFARNDLGIERLEFVKGGVSNLFGVSSTAGILNYISKTGTDELSGTLQLEVAEDNRYRGDFAVQGPLGENTYYAVSGFYRYDDGPIDTGQPTEGFALRGNIHHDLSDGSGFFRIHGTYIDDRVNFYLPLPLDSTTRERLTGNNGETVFSTNVSAVDGVRVPTPEGQTEFRAADGFMTSGGSVYAIFEKDLGDGWGLDAKIKYSDYRSSSNFFNNGTGIQEPETQAQFAARTGIAAGGALNPGGAPVVFTDAASGAVLDPSFLLYQGGFNDRQRPTTDGTLEFNITKEFETGDLTHNLTIGTFISRAEADNVQRSVQFLTQFNNDPEFVNVTVGGQEYTVNGLIRATSGYANQTRSAFKRAFYIADQIEADRWSFDIGMRVETATIKNRFELTSTQASTLSANPLPGAPINTLSFGTGGFREGEATDTAWAIAGGALYRLTDDINIYANASRGYFFPQAQGTGGQINTVGDIAVFNEEPIVQGEVGIKYNGSSFRGSAAVFYVGLRDRNTVVFVGPNLDAQVTPTEVDTFGIELDGSFSLTDTLNVTGNFTYQDAKFVGGSPAGILDQEVNRLPKVLANLGAVYDDDRFDASIFWNHQGRTFQDASNNVPLEAYSIVRAEIGYTFPVDDGDGGLRVSAGVWNLLDSEGLAEGNPRAGLVQNLTASPFFNGRPILPRRFSFRLTYDF